MDDGARLRRARSGARSTRRGSGSRSACCSSCRSSTPRRPLRMLHLDLLVLSGVLASSLAFFNAARDRLVGAARLPAARLPRWCGCCGSACARRDAAARRGRSRCSCRCRGSRSRSSSCSASASALNITRLERHRRRLRGRHRRRPPRRRRAALRRASRATTSTATRTGRSSTSRTCRSSRCCRGAARGTTCPPRTPRRSCSTCCACSLLLPPRAAHPRAATSGSCSRTRWVAFPFTLFASNTNANDALSAALVLAALLAAAQPVRRGARCVALAGLTKFAPLALAPLFASHRGRGRGRSRGSRSAFARRGALVVSSRSLAHGDACASFWDATLGFQADRGVAVLDLGAVRGRLDRRVQHVVQALAVVLARRASRSCRAGATSSGWPRCARRCSSRCSSASTYWFYLYIAVVLPARHDRAARPRRAAGARPAARVMRRRRAVALAGLTLAVAVGARDDDGPVRRHRRVNDLYVYRSYADLLRRRAAAVPRLRLRVPAAGGAADLARRRCSAPARRRTRSTFARAHARLRAARRCSARLGRRSRGRRVVGVAARALQPILIGASLRTHFDALPVALALGALLALRARPPGRSGFALLGLGDDDEALPRPARARSSRASGCSARGERARRAARRSRRSPRSSLVVSLPFAGAGYVEQVTLPPRPAGADRVDAGDRAVGARRLRTSPGRTCARTASSPTASTAARPTRCRRSSALLLVGALAGSSRSPLARRDARASSCAASPPLLAFVALGKVLSPQYVIWLAPFAALAWAWGERGAARSSPRRVGADAGRVPAPLLRPRRTARTWVVARRRAAQRAAARRARAHPSLHGRRAAAAARSRPRAAAATHRMSDAHEPRVVVGGLERARACASTKPRIACSCRRR